MRRDRLPNTPRHCDSRIAIPGLHVPGFARTTSWRNVRCTATLDDCIIGFLVVISAVGADVAELLFRKNGVDDLAVVYCMVSQVKANNFMRVRIDSQMQLFPAASLGFAINA